MVLETLLDIFFTVTQYFLDFLPKAEIVLEDSNMQPFLDVISGILYFFPMGTVKYILGVAFTIIVVRIVISLLKTVIEIIPFV